jgi:hypothetical protein
MSALIVLLNTSHIDMQQQVMSLNSYEESCCCALLEGSNLLQLDPGRVSVHISHLYYKEYTYTDCCQLVWVWQYYVVLSLVTFACWLIWLFVIVVYLLKILSLARIFVVQW